MTVILHAETVPPPTVEVDADADTHRPAGPAATRFWRPGP